MKIDEICKLPIQKITGKDAVLFSMVYVPNVTGSIATNKCVGIQIQNDRISVGETKQEW